jgi:hypothetical protein
MPANDAPVARTHFDPRGTWENRHKSFVAEIGGMYEITYRKDVGKLTAYNAVTGELQAILADAIANNRRLCAFGAGWSLSRIGITDGRMIDTKRLRIRAWLKPDSISPDYPGDGKFLRFLQCGNPVIVLNKYLAEQHLSLKASGANNGQTIVGAISTGTHGGGLDVGALQDFVVGLHVIVSPTETVWLERASRPVVSDAFVAKLDARLIRDDTQFNAALVGLGAFGIVHGAVIETEKRFLLEAHLRWIDLDHGMFRAIEELDFSDPRFPHPGERPFHVDLTINPNEPRARVYAKIMYKRPYALGVIGELLDAGIIPEGLMRATINDGIAELNAQFGPQFGTIGEIFSSEKTRGKTFTTGMGVPLANAREALQAGLEGFRAVDRVLPVLITLRYAAKSDALLAITKHDPSCVLEVDGIDNDLTREVARRVRANLEAAGIPYTEHWGKMNELNRAHIDKVYGPAAQQWIDTRNALLPPDVRAVFTSPELVRLGLNS